MLLHLYPDADVRTALLEDPQTAPIPDLHKAAFRFAQRYVRHSADMGPQDLQDLRDAGLSEADIVTWATLGSTQTWFTLSADGGGIPLEGGMEVGPVVGRVRADYAARPVRRLVEEPQAAAAGAENGCAWVGAEEACEGYLEAAAWAEDRYGFTPNLLRAVSLAPKYYRRHQLALELLERPQSETLTPRLHAMVRAIVSQSTYCAYSRSATRALLELQTGNGSLWERLAPGGEGDWDSREQVVVDFARKLSLHSYKTTAADAEGFRQVGLGDEGYVDVLNTASIQLSLDRLANALGVVPDQQPMVRDGTRVALSAVG